MDIFIVVSASQRLAVCKDCMNDYGNQLFDKLIEKLRKNAGLPETK